jgi:S-adenosylhomocysteine hydrolase
MRVEAPVHPHKATPTRPAQAAPAAAEPKTASAGKGDEFAQETLPPFASFFAASKNVPHLPKGTTLQTFTEAQVQALHRAYWSAPPTATLPDMIKLAWKDKAFAGVKQSDRVDRQVGLTFADLPESFPWGWRSRALSATSHVLVEAMLSHPKGSAFTAIVSELQKKHPGFPTVDAWKQARLRSWQDEPERFPFLSKVPKEGKLHVLAALGHAPDVRKDSQGRFTMNEAIARRVRELSLGPSIGYGWSDDQVAELIDRELKGDGAFTVRSLKYLRAEFPKLVPQHNAIYAAGAKRLAENVRRLYDNEGITSASQMAAELKKRFKVDLGIMGLSHLRQLNPDLVPNFRQEKDDASYADARTLLDAIVRNKDQSYLETGRSVGFDKARVMQLLILVHKRWPDELPKLEARRYTDADRAALRKFYDTRELGENAQTMFERFKVEASALYEKFPFANSMTFYAALRGILKVPPLYETRKHQYLEALADVARRSRPGTSLHEMVGMLQDENRYAYSESGVIKLLRDARAHPEQFPELKKVRDANGAFVWEKSQVPLTEDLAREVGAAIEASPGKTNRQICALLMRDKKFAHLYPTFGYDHIYSLRVRFPKLVPFVDDLKLQGRNKRLDAWHTALMKIGDRIEAAAAKVDDPDGLTVAELGRRLKLKPYRVLAAIRFEPGRFPWYGERPAGEIDLFLATRVAEQMSRAPLGAELGDVMADLQSDPRFRDRYPAFNYLTFRSLRDRYPDIVPQWSTRDQVLRSKLLVDALAGAPKGTPFKKVAEGLEQRYPGMFSASYARPSFVRALWESDPEVFSFAKVLHGKLEGQGAKVAPGPESPQDLAMRLAKLERIPEQLPLIDKLGAVGNKVSFQDFEVLAVQHVLGSQVALFEGMRKMGLKPDRTAIVAIPYSASEPVVDTLQDKGWDVRVPPLDLEKWYGMVHDALVERLDAAKQSGRRVLVLDDGGLTTMIFDKYPELAKDKGLVKIVEQTRRGITVADGSKLGSPVINVAQSWGKFVEGPMIGNSLQKKLVSRLTNLGVQLKGKHVGVIGYGTIGGPLALYLKSIGAHVTVLDSGEEAEKQAAHEGLTVAKDRHGFFAKQDVIVGATGQRSMTAEDLAALKDGAVIGSGSSKLVEIDVEALAAMVKGKGGKVEVLDAKSYPPTVRYTTKDGRRIVLLAKGFPVNFDGDIEDIEPERIQLTRGLMLIGALQAAGMSAAGVHRLDPELQLTLLDAFESVGGRKVGADVVDALDIAKDNLGFLKKNRSDLDHDRRHRPA